MTGVILIVEDHADTATALERLLSRCGHRVTIAESGEAAVAIFDAAAEGGEPVPQVVILDMGLPRMDGIDVLRELRARRPLARVPVIVYTADFSQHRMRHAQTLGAREYLVKGTTSWEALTDAVQRCLNDAA